jgi:acylphosphatase
MDRQLHAVVSGRVQGVSFRFYTVSQAQQLGIRGWVRNLPDGTVETVAEGDESALEAFLAYLHHGPSGARVAALAVEWRDADGNFDDFQITR